MLAMKIGHLPVRKNSSIVPADQISTARWIIENGLRVVKIVPTSALGSAFEQHLGCSKASSPSSISFDCSSVESQNRELGSTIRRKLPGIVGRPSNIVRR